MSGSNDPFESEKSWSNVSSSRSKSRWGSASGVDQSKAEKFQKGFLESSKPSWMKAKKDDDYEDDKE
jgi:hypothetical protein